MRRTCERLDSGLRDVERVGAFGTIVALLTPLEFPIALLLGAILSATDPVAVVALFRQLGAPQRLTILVEGESLFNDATALVAAKILTGVVVAGAFSMSTLASGGGEFFAVFLGGILYSEGCRTGTPGSWNGGFVEW